MGVMKRQARRHKQLLDALKEKKKHEFERGNH